MRVRVRVRVRVELALHRLHAVSLTSRRGAAPHARLGLGALGLARVRVRARVRARARVSMPALASARSAWMHGHCMDITWAWSGGLWHLGCGSLRHLGLQPPASRVAASST